MGGHRVARQARHSRGPNMGGKAYRVLHTPNGFFHGTEREQRKVVWIWTVLGLSWPCKLFYFYFPILSSMRVGQEWLEYVPSKANNTYGKGIGSMCHE